ncbi:glycoside hydrolase family 88 protein [Uliginosibacterium sp. H3]|uniref:Glycoside hydrolase family 88 protein n=1 Tax=Uliginosibacterium silvisoli TaxID=3114758 RepID=A0ABU6JYA1_9RHOO|nr:glycoside hydrolase family 88 protein [Uliginosibacterium sp. H3]
MSFTAKTCATALVGIGMFSTAMTANATPVPGNHGNYVANYMINTWPVLDDYTTCAPSNCFSLNYATVPASPAPKFWEYTNTVPLFAIWKLYEKTGRQKYYDYVKKFVDTYVDANGVINYGRTFPAGATPNDPTIQDTIQPATLLFGLYKKTGDSRYLKAMQYVRTIFPTIKTNPQGAWWHKPTYANEQWLDAIYMSTPFLARYAAQYETGATQTATFNTLTNQIKLAAQYTFNPTKNLYYHGWNGATDGIWVGLDYKAGKYPPLDGQVTSPILWARSQAWYITGIVDVLEYLPKNHPDRNQLVQIVKNIAKGLKTYQGTNGLWYQVLDVKDGPLPANGGYPGESVPAQANWQETSASALFVYSLAKAARLDIIDSSYLDVAKKGWAGVKTKVALSNSNNTVKVQGTVVGMSLGGVYNAYTNADFRTDLNNGPLPAPADQCVPSTYVKFTSPPVVCKYSYVRENVPQGLGAVMLAASEMEY